MEAADSADGLADFETRSKRNPDFVDATPVGRKKIIIILLSLCFLFAIGGGGAYYLLHHDTSNGGENKQIKVNEASKKVPTNKENQVFPLSGILNAGPGVDVKVDKSPSTSVKRSAQNHVAEQETPPAASKQDLETRVAELEKEVKKLKRLPEAVSELDKSQSKALQLLKDFAEKNEQISVTGKKLTPKKVTVKSTPSKTETVGVREIYRPSKYAQKNHINVGGVKYYDCNPCNR